MQEELYHEGSSPLHRPDLGGGIPVYPPNLHPWSPGVVSGMYCKPSYISYYIILTNFTNFVCFLVFYTKYG